MDKEMLLRVMREAAEAPEAWEEFNELYEDD
jgi:hypothetical protein